jgi:tetratricopeptide (TPR) repeat protein
LADDVIKQFSDLSELSVINSRSSFRFKNTDKSIAELSKALKADLIMDGSYALDDGTLRVKIELIAGKTNEIICYASPTSNLDEVKSIAAVIEREVFKSLKIPLNTDKQNLVDDERKVNVEAYKYYALGKGALRDNTLQDREEIIKYFKAAIKLDSSFVDPYLGIAEAYFFDVNRGYLSTAEASHYIRKYAMEAERLKPGAGEVQGLLGGLYCLEYNFKESLVYLEKSIRISPNYDFSYIFYAYALVMDGQFEKSMAIVDKAMILDPMNSFYFGFKVLIDIYRRKYDEAIESLEEQLRLNPNHKHTLFWLGIANLESKDYSSAYKTFVKRGVGLKTNFAVGYTYAKMGMKEEALIVLNHLLAAEYVPPVQIAILYVGLEQYDKALEQVELAFLARDSWFMWIKYSGLLDPIRDDPRYLKVMEMINYQ